MEENLSLKVRILKRPVEIALLDGNRMQGHFFVSPCSAHHPGNERIDEILNDERAFIPVESAEGAVTLLLKASILYVRSMEKNPTQISALDTSAHGKVFFLSGDILEGRVPMELPKTHNRLSDFLNCSRQFFPFEVNHEMHFINSKRVKMVTPVS